MPDLTEQGTEARSDFYAGLPTGTRLGQYELKSILGQGAFGITYRARDLAGDRDVAIKEYLPATLALRKDRTTVIPRSGDLAEQFAWGRERFLEEANTLKRLEGTSSIVQVHDFLEAHGTAYMVMALIEGETMAKRLLREHRLTAEALERLLFPLLDGLEKVHAAGFLHRDIKPANIMIDMKGSPTLIDFGASRAALAGRSTTFTAIFTPGYAAAEQFASSNLGPWTDIYGLAATLYHAISGQVPPSAIERMFKDEYKPLVELQPLGFSPAFLDSIDRALVVTSADRPQSIAEWRRMLASSLDVTRIARRPGRLARAVNKTRRKRLNIGAPAIGLISAAVLAAVGGIGYVAFTAGAPPTVSVAALSLSAEQLEQALAERRKADAQAADMARREDEARQKAQAEAEAKRQADEQLEQTRQARLKAEQELAELNARLAEQRRTNADQANRAVEEAAQRKAEQEAQALVEAEERAAKQAATEAEAKRQADEALAKVEAERRQAEEAARAKAEAEQAALRQASEGAQRKAAEAESVKQAEQERLKAEAERAKAEAERQRAEAELKLRAEAEAAEKSLRLDQPARERLQLALTSLGFDTRGSDGIFGPRSREMISAWQKARNQPVTGFLNTAQQQALLKEAAPALAKLDEQKKGEEEAKARIASVQPTTATSGDTSGPPPDGLWRGTYQCSSDRFPSVNLEARLTNGSGTWFSVNASASANETVSVRLSIEWPNVIIARVFENRASTNTQLAARLEGNAIRASNSSCSLVLTRGNETRHVASAVGQPAPVAAHSGGQSSLGSAAQPSTSAYDGTYSGRASTGTGTGASPIAVALTVTNGRGAGTLAAPGCSPSGFTLAVQGGGKVSGEGHFNCWAGHSSGLHFTGAFNISGAHNGKSFALSFVSERGYRIDTVLTPRAVNASTLPSPDGLWRGSYACTALSSAALLPRFTLELNLKIANGISSGGGFRESAATGGTLNIEVSVESSKVTVTRTYKSNTGNTPATRGVLQGQFDGTSIRANGSQFIGPVTSYEHYNCTLALTRA